MENKPYRSVSHGNECALKRRAITHLQKHKCIVSLRLPARMIPTNNNCDDGHRSNSVVLLMGCSVWVIILWGIVSIDSPPPPALEGRGQQPSAKQSCQIGCGRANEVVSGCIITTL
eukprot:scaffold6927_cov93-Cylindrotheca_fusiformis.AAC.4